MKVSRKFLNDYVDLSNIDYHELAEKMVFVGNEYENIGRMSESKGLIVGQILECEKHPDSEKLHVCKVQLNEHEIKQIICGAPNVGKDQKVIVAPVGATLPDGTQIKKAHLAGMDSEGMICSLSEIGIETKYQSEEDKTGIHVLSNDAVIGTDAIVSLGYDDEVIDFELTANRGDLMSILGLAYEVGAIYQKKVTIPEIVFHETGDAIDKTHQLTVSTEDCSLYLGKLVSNVVIGNSPDFIKTRLIASGIRPINNVVDISNYVMLEYGQPLHFFDADRLGNNVVVRHAKPDEKITTLDGNERILKEKDLVIANEKEPVALAGVMGGLSTEVENDTKNIFIESAIFNPLTIRSTAKDSLRSEASARYEKGIDPNRTENALKRACELLEKYASGTVHPGLLKHDQSKKEDSIISLSVEKMNAVLGMPITHEIAEDVFTRLEFSYTKKEDIYEVAVPTRRLDITIAEDLIEEVGRIYGYDHMEGILPIVPIKKGTRSQKTELIKIIKNHCRSFGLSEVITYSLISEQESNQFISEPYEKIILLDPMSEDKKVMRNSHISSLLKVFDYNIARNQKEIAIFEVGSCYRHEATYVEEMKLSGLLYGTYFENKWQGQTVLIDFYLMKGIIESLMKYLGYSNRYEFSIEPLADLHPGRSATILLDHEKIGYLGQIHPNMSKKEVYVFEISIDKILQKTVRNLKFKELNKFPSVNRDMAFMIPKEMPSSNVTKQIQKSAGRYLTNLEIFDVYMGENVAENKKSIAYALTFTDPTKTLNDQEITAIFEKIIHDVIQNCQAELRDK